MEIKIVYLRIFNFFQFYNNNYKKNNYRVNFYLLVNNLQLNIFICLLTFQHDKRDVVKILHFVTGYYFVP